MKTSLLITVFLFGTAAFGWGDLGHQTVGEIAQRHLSPKGKRLVESILGHGPLAEAATFPDLVRSDKDFGDFANFHFVEIDPRYEGEYAKIPVSLREDIDANSLISGIPRKLFKGFIFPVFSEQQKMDLMRYLVHLVGDVHQPLHVGNGYDRGANWCDIKYVIGEEIDPVTKETKLKTKDSNLHSFWDSVLVEEVFYAEKRKNAQFKMPSWKGWKELADIIIADQKDMDKEKVAATPVGEWYKESQELHSKVYPDGDRKLHPSEREYCKRLVKDANGKPEMDAKGVAITIKPTQKFALISKEYMAEANEIIKSRIMKAGLRLAHIINDMGDKRFKWGKKGYESKKVEELKEILKEFANH